MYHIKNDKRAKESAEIIYKGLQECLKSKQFDLITISDIQRTSSVARSTFYRCFDNLSDVLYWKCDTCFNEVLFGYAPCSIFDELDFAKHYFKYWMNNSSILELLIKINRQDIIYACHMKNAEIMKEQFGQIPNLPIKHPNYFMAIRTGFTISVLTACLVGGRKESVDEIIDIIEEQLKIISKSANPFAF